MTYQTREVLADSYRLKSKRLMLTHTVRVSDSGDYEVICNRVLKDSIADANANPNGVNLPPTCKVCLRKDPRYSGL